jgi:hypothetical protein
VGVMENISGVQEILIAVGILIIAIICSTIMCSKKPLDER